MYVILYLYIFNNFGQGRTVRPWERWNVVTDGRAPHCVMGTPSVPGRRTKRSVTVGVPHSPLVLQLRYGLCFLNLQIRSLPFRVQIKGLSEWTIM